MPPEFESLARPALRFLSSIVVFGDRLTTNETLALAHFLSVLRVRQDAPQDQMSDAALIAEVFATRPSIRELQGLAATIVADETLADVIPAAFASLAVADGVPADSQRVAIKRAQAALRSARQPDETAEV